MFILEMFRQIFIVRKLLTAMIATIHWFHYLLNCPLIAAVRHLLNTLITLLTIVWFFSSMVVLLVPVQICDVRKFNAAMIASQMFLSSFDARIRIRFLDNTFSTPVIWFLSVNQHMFFQVDVHLELLSTLVATQLHVVRNARKAFSCF